MKHYQIYLLSLIMFIAFIARANAVTSVLTDRAPWQQAVTGTIATENFESEQASYDSLTLPYTTENGITLNWINPHSGVIQMIPDGFNGSIAPQFRDFGDQLSIILPSNTPINAIGFDYSYGGPEKWEMYINGSKLTLTADFPPHFIGIVDTTNLISSFVLTSPSYDQGGLSIDNLSYNIAPEPISCILFVTGGTLLAGRRYLKKRKG